MENSDHLLVTSPESEKNGKEIEIVEDYILNDPKYATPAMLVPGWALTMESFRPVLKKIYDSGRSARALKDTHGLDDEIVDNFFKKCEQNDQLDLEGIKKSLNQFPPGLIKRSVAVLEGIGKGQDDVIGVSLGGYEAAIATYLDAMLNPFPGNRHIRNLVLVDPAGLVEQHSRATLAKNAISNSVVEGYDSLRGKYEGSQEAKQNMATGAKDQWLNVIPRHFKETMLDDPKAITQAQITELLEKLRKEYGVNITIIYASGDMILPMKNVLDLKEKENGKLGLTKESKPRISSKSADIFLTPEGGHNAPVSYEKLMELMGFALDKMETMPAGRIEEKDKLEARNKTAREYIDRALGLLDNPMKKYGGLVTLPDGSLMKNPTNYDKAVQLAKGTEMLVYGASNERKKNGKFDKDLAADLEDLNVKIFAVKS